ncbi:MAG: hypothetical protein GC129_01635 [Proteobacteria bacterium]|nr:hypothetical protein [Pseudomonadota bacterium]
MAETTPQANIQRPRIGRLARARLAWALKPLGFLVLVLWVFYPSTADRFDHTHTALLGFLFGALYGLVVYGAALRQYVQLRQPLGRLQANRVPEEYYWGKVENVLFDNS